MYLKDQLTIKVCLKLKELKIYHLLLMLIEFIKVLNHEKVHQELLVAVQANKITLKLHGALIKPTRMQYQIKAKILNANSIFLK